MEIDKIICGNSFDVIKNFPDRYFDAVILDPPFGIGKVYNGKKEIANSPDEYWKFLSPMWNEIQRVIKVGGFIAVWQAQLYFKNFWTWFGDDIHIYCSAKNFVQLRKVAINYSYDPIIFKYFKSDEAILSPKSPKRNLDFFVSNTAKFVRETNSLAKKHPYPRPIDVVCEIVDNFVVEGGIVLDPFVGSGTTAVACKRSGRHFVGIEIDETYCSLAEERIRLNE